jgi:glyoxylase I family protein
MEVKDERPHDRLPFGGKWYWIGGQSVHLMELPNPDPMDGRAEHGGRDRHVCVNVKSIDPVIERLDAAGVEYTMSKSGRRAVFFRDPDMNTMECLEA